MQAKTKFENLFIGSSLQQRRESLKLSRNEVAAKLNIRPQKVANWEGGECKPPKNIIPKLMDVYNLSRKEICEIYIKAAKIGLREYFDQLDD